MEQHTEFCKNQQAKREQWLATWVNHCPTCKGAGVIVTGGDMVDYGSTRVSLPDYADPCETCWGNCPRCGEQLYTSDDAAGDAFDQQTPCPFCGWEWGKGKDDICPDAECYCWEVYEPDPYPVLSSPDDWLEAAYEERFEID